MAVLAFNSHLDLLVGASFVRVAEVVALALSETADDIDITNHDSTDRWSDYLQGLKTGEIAIEGNWLPANNTHDYNDDGLLGLFDNGEMRTWKLWLGNGANASIPLTFHGWVIQLQQGAMHDTKLEFSLVLRAVRINSTTTFVVARWTESFEPPTYTVGSAEFTEPFEPPYVVNSVAEWTETFNAPTYTVGSAEFTETFES